MAGLKRHHDGKIAGLYDLDKTLGRGHFAVVKLARHVFTGEKVDRFSLLLDPEAAPLTCVCASRSQ